MKTLKAIVILAACFSSSLIMAQGDALIHQYKFDGDLKDAVGDSNGIFVEGSGYSPTLLDNFIDGHDGTPKGALNCAAKFMICVGRFSPIREGVKGQMTITFWGLWHGETPGGYQDIINQRDNWSPDKMTWGINQHKATGHHISLRRQGLNADSKQGMPLEKWTHVAVAFDSATGDLWFYMDGVKYDYMAYESGTGHNAKIHMGSAGNADGTWRPGDAYNGALDDVRFYSRVLTDAEILAIYQGKTSTKKKCMFLSEDPGHAQDVELLAWLKSVYDVTEEDVDNVKSGNPDTTAIKAANYDFIFISESVGSGDAAVLKGFSVPVFLTEGWASRLSVMGWVANNSGNVMYGSTSLADENKVKILDGTHALAAGFATDSEVTIVSATGGSANEFLTWTKPTVDCKKIGILTTDPEKVVVLGVEKGTVLYNAVDTKDGSVVSKARCAAVGVHGLANKFLTDDGKKLIQAGIDWITDKTTAVEKQGFTGPAGYALNQNYPNPFNPETKIEFTLNRAMNTKMGVFDISGRLVAILVNGKMEQGKHMVHFNAANIPSGVYFCKIETDEFIQVRKMTLMK